MPPAIEAKGLTRVFGGSRRRAPIRAVDGVCLRVQPGEAVALLGPNGAGKTTMVRLLACLLRPTDGSAQVCGHDIRDHPGKVRALCGVSTESPALYSRLRASEYLRFFARLYGVTREQAPGRVDEQLRRAGLWDRRNDLLATFSKGMRQKINIARALVHRPQVVFLDEPTSGLDVEAARSVRRHIQDMTREAETTFLICTHNLPEAERLCQRIAVMKAGRILATGAPEALKQQLFAERVFRVRIPKLLPAHAEAVASVPGVRKVAAEGDELIVHVSGRVEEVNPRLLRRLLDAGAHVTSLAGDEPSLEEIYLRLLREEPEAGEAEA